MNTEYGIFSDEGLIEGLFFSKAAAEAKLAKDYAEAKLAKDYAEECCYDHPEQERDACHECQVLDAMEEAEQPEPEEPFTNDDRVFGPEETAIDSLQQK